MLNKNDIAQLQQQQRDITKAQKQIEIFKQGFPFLSLIKPARVEDGIKKPGEEEIRYFISNYEKKLAERKVLKFVPASGAATRMFKSLFSFLEKFNGSAEGIALMEKETGPESIHNFISHIEEFAFYEELKNKIKAAGMDISQMLKEKKYGEVINYVIIPAGLDYGNLPKGLIKFHKYGKVARTSVEEHLVEGADYARYHDGKVNIHFTISPEHDEKFRNHVARMTPCYENHLEVQYYVNFSVQNPGTDTISVDHENQPFRTSSGSILFRPAGHGALLENLNDLDSDLIFIKNIDNVVPDRLKEITARYKKVLGGVLLHYQEMIFNYLDILEREEILNPSLMEEIHNFLEKEIGIIMPEKNNLDAREYYIRKLNRPIRVCGMVKNAGEPGGGPFWTHNPDGSFSLQIVESAQVDLKDENQYKIFSAATHFNPVDLVIGTKDRHGHKFDLKKYVDPMTGFISIKSQEGRELKALELPGLWNGSMSDWNTIFVEVPIETFNPVKIINDLLRPEHR